MIGTKKKKKKTDATWNKVHGRNCIQAKEGRPQVLREISLSIVRVSIEREDTAKECLKRLWMQSDIS
jgi:hypothetical protein